MREHETGWEEGWEGHERAQLLRLSRLSMAEKLDWLEEAHELALRIARARQGAPDPSMGGE
jgi:hypothetical protein